MQELPEYLKTHTLISSKFIDDFFSLMIIKH